MYYNNYDDLDSSSDCAAHETVIVRGARPRRRRWIGHKDSLIRKNAEGSSGESSCSSYISTSASRSFLQSGPSNKNHELVNDEITAPLSPFTEPCFPATSSVKSRRDESPLEIENYYSHNIPNTVTDTNEGTNESHNGRSSQQTSAGQNGSSMQGADNAVPHITIVTTGNQTEGLLIEKSTMTSAISEAIRKHLEKLKKEEEDAKVNKRFAQIVHPAFPDANVDSPAIELVVSPPETVNSSNDTPEPEVTVISEPVIQKISQDSMSLYSDDLSSTSSGLGNVDENGNKKKRSKKHRVKKTKSSRSQEKSTCPSWWGKLGIGDCNRPIEDADDCISSYDGESSSESADVEEKDSEWLNLSQTHITPAAEKLRRTQVLLSIAIALKNKKRRTLNPMDPLFVPVSDSMRKYLLVTKIINLAMIYLGRFPIEVETVSDGTFQYRLSTSWRHHMYGLTSVLFGLAGLLMFANSINIYMTEPLTLDDRIIKLEMDMYFIEAMIEILNLLFLTVASISVLKIGGGIHLVDFMNRWADALNLIQYDVSNGIQRLMRLFFLGYASYAAFFIFLFCFGGEAVSTVRGSCGYLGILLIHGFTENIRVHWGYRFVEVLGLVLHLYSTLCSGLFILMISIHCRGLNNAAKRFNERLNICIRGGSFEIPGEPTPKTHTIIPFRKVFAEHVVITSFTHQTGLGFFVPLNGYLIPKIVTMIATLTVLMQPFIRGFVTTYYPDDVNSELKEWTVPVGYEPAQLVYLKHLFYAALNWGTWIFFMEEVLTPGITIMKGGSIVLKNTYIRCKTSHALRFITSLQFSFNNKTTFYVSPGMRINRECMAKLVGFVFISAVGIVQFNPEFTGLNEFIVCEPDGLCTLYSAPIKVMTKETFVLTVGNVINNNLQKSTQELKKEDKFRVFPVPFPPCAGNGKHPLVAADYAVKCNPKHEIYTPTYFIKDGSLVFIQVPPVCYQGSLTQKLDFFRDKQYYDSYGYPVSGENVTSDECGNPMLNTPDKFGVMTSPIMNVAKIGDRVFCCFVYANFDNFTKDQQHCNLVPPVEETALKRCSVKSKVVDREIWEKKIVDSWNKKTPGKTLEETRELWTNCLCQGVGTIPIWGDACRLKPRTTTTTTIATTTTTTTTTTEKPTKKPPKVGCGSMSDKMCLECQKNPEQLLEVFEEKFVETCPIEHTNGHMMLNPLAFDPFTGDFKLVRSGCGPTDSVPEELNPDAKYFDCFGNNITIGKKQDDCGNYHLEYPEKVTGNRKSPVMKMLRLPSKVFGVVRFICCWDYSDWQFQNVKSVCNMYPGSSLDNACSVRDAVSELEATEVCNNAMFHNDINTFYKTRCLESKTKNYEGKLCDNPKLEIILSPRYFNRKRLKQSFLPCPYLEMHWKTFSSEILKHCPIKTGFKHFPYLNKDLEKVYPPSNRRNCITKVSTRPSEGYYDCYGFMYEKDELLDDCGTPGLLTPSKDPSSENSPYSEPVAPKLKYVNYYKNFYVCCWQFDTQTGARCNLAGNALSTCAFRTEITDKDSRKDMTSMDDLCDENEIFDKNGVNRHYISRCPTGSDEGPPVICTNPDIYKALNHEDNIA